MKESKLTKDAKTILITGGAGFIGSNFVRYIINKHDYDIVNLDNLTYASVDITDNQDLFQSIENYKFVKADITNVEELEHIFKTYNITDVIHFAAESHVDNSISSPTQFINTNINGTFNLIETFRKLKCPGRFHHISTDEVYGSIETGLFTETSCYNPNSPYSASKASSDMIIRSYIETYNLNAVITNCSNNYGANQHVEKLIPKTIKAILENDVITVYGDGLNIRDWLYVEDHCSAIDLVFHKGENTTYNVGGSNELANIEVINIIANILNKKANIKYVKDRAGHDRRYAIDASKIKELGWVPQYDFHTGIQETTKFYSELYNEALKN